MNLSYLFLFLMFIASAMAYAGEYIPKAIYLIDRNGRKSDLMPLLRVRRGGSYATSYSSSSGGGNAGGTVPPFFNDFLSGGFNPANFVDPGFAQNVLKGANKPEIFSRFGETTGDGVHVSSSAQGPHAAFSSSSSSVDSNGKIKYSTQSGKY